MHSLLLHNDAILETSTRMLEAGQVGFLNGWGVFSTLRVMDGVLFAFERHWQRMKRDAQLLHVPMPESADWLEERLLRLVEANAQQDCTLRVAIVRNRGGLFEGPHIRRDFDVIAFTTALREWGDAARLGVVPNARHSNHEFAGTKMLSWSFNLVWLENAVNAGWDEVALLDERGYASECTSANLFAVFGDRVVTPPLSCGCLPGITRNILLEEIRVPGVSLEEREIALIEFGAADEIFMTSSTRELLRVSEIDGVELKPETPARARVRLLLHERFRRYMRSYTETHRRAPAG